MEEIYICTQHLKGVGYSDVLMMPTYERRYFLSLHTKHLKKQEEQMDDRRQNTKNSSSKGKRTTKISGDALKSRIERGDIPLE